MSGDRQPDLTTESEGRFLSAFGCLLDASAKSTNLKHYALFGGGKLRGYPESRSLQRFRGPDIASLGRVVVTGGTIECGVAVQTWTQWR